MPRHKFWGFSAAIISLSLGALIIYNTFININMGQYNFFGLSSISGFTYYTLAAPVFIVSLAIIGTGFWIGFTILSIKVVPPMPELVEKKDTSKIKAVILCILSFSAAALLLYGILIRSYWAIAIPATVISFVILGAIFWVGIAIITARKTLPEKNAGQK